MKRIIIACTAAVFAAGCNEPPARIANLRGKVIYNGSPVTSGTLVMKSLEPDPQVMMTDARINDDGSFAQTGVPVGVVRLAVRGGTIGAESRPVPAKFADPEHSGLEITVEPGDHATDIVLGP